MITCSKLYVTKIKYSQCQRTKDKTKTSVNFAVILCKCVCKNGI